MLPLRECPLIDAGRLQHSLAVPHRPIAKLVHQFKPMSISLNVKRKPKTRATLVIGACGTIGTCPPHLQQCLPFSRAPT
jgi:hypothetical protein